MTQSLITVAVRFPASRTRFVNDQLDGFGNPPNQHLAQRLDAVAFVHFMSMVVVPARGTEKFAHLVIEASVDGHARAALVRLAKAIPDVLRAVLDAAVLDPPPEGGLSAYLEKNRLDVDRGWFASFGWFATTTGLDFFGTPGMTVPRICAEALLAARIRGLLEADRTPTSALRKLSRVRESIFKDPEMKWAFVCDPVPLLGEAGSKLDALPALVRTAFRDFFLPLVPLPVLVFLHSRFIQGLDVDRAFWHSSLTVIGEVLLALAGVLIGYRLLRRKEKADVPIDAEPREEDMRKILDRENQPGYAQNHLAAVSILKLGLVRRVTLRIALWLIAESAPRHSSPGFIDKIGTIHFAHWVRLPGTDRLVFFSNYDGSWQSYLEDFIARLHAGLTSVWSNTLDFPKTANLAIGGAGDGARFKRWARRQQQATRFWYSAYPELTNDRIRTNASIRHGFAAAGNEVEAASWLTQFGYPAPVNLEKEQISALAFGGLSFFPHAYCLLLSFVDHGPDARRWLSSIANDLSYGEHASLTKDSTTVGFTRSGLEKLGLDKAAIQTFPTAFLQGMHNPSRARALGVGDDSLDGWWWGRTGEVDAVLLLYARDAEELCALIVRAKGLLIKHGHRQLTEIKLRDLGMGRDEPFRFKDGISQPKIRGSKGWSDPEYALHLVEAGELVLGYHDNLGNLSPTPSLRGQDIGRNGSFLVVQQLEQHVDRFDHYVEQQAALLDRDPLDRDPRAPSYDREGLKEWVAARMVGRWRDGSSLVRYSHPPTMREPRRPEDNDFQFGLEDPNGLRCPLGAHIRRANPRDSFEPGSQLQLAITNRHRIMRVGRVYEPAANQDPGLLFMCLNADIERQFEFLQQTWILGSNFHGLDNEIDPIVGYRSDNDSMTVPTPVGPLRLGGLSKFVTMRGGAYFFVPGKSAVRALAA